VQCLWPLSYSDGTSCSASQHSTFATLRYRSLYAPYKAFIRKMHSSHASRFPENLGSLLGLFPSIRRGSAYHHQQGEETLTLFSQCLYRLLTTNAPSSIIQHCSYCSWVSPRSALSSRTTFNSVCKVYSTYFAIAFFSHQPFTDLYLRLVVATTTIWSGASYLWSKDTIRIVRPPRSPPS
jgi:hypothetical protein